MSTLYLAHSANRGGKVDPLRDHLTNVAKRAAEFAGAFDASAEAYLAGLFHDVGKYGELFQRRLQGKEKGIDHWSAGAWTALMEYKDLGIASALSIQGHHVGLQQAAGDSLRLLDPSKLRESEWAGLRLSEKDMAILLKRFDEDGLQRLGASEIGHSLYSGLKGPAVASMLDVRMLFSALVDADFIETEAHFQPDPHGYNQYRQPGPPLNPEHVFDILSIYLENLAKKSGASSEVRGLRRDLLRACIEGGPKPPGIFTLTSPTGSGKTLSLLAFALKHAAINGLRRIVVVIPYLSIIEQTVQEYRKAFASGKQEGMLEDYVLENHSLAGTKDKTARGHTEDADNEDEARRRTRLLAENWDAPIVVTTSVQFLESLFSNRPSACRKLHRLAKSVILFDEVQTLPVPLAVPTLAALSRLTERYGATVVFSTATQPAFRHLSTHVEKYCAPGWKPSEIVPPNLNLFERAKRTAVEWPTDLTRPTTWSELAHRLGREEQALCILNLKRHALALFDQLRKMKSEGLFHLSTNMCPAHRSEVLDLVKQRLMDGKPCHLISTQCVEAGVDVDFPTVFRAWGPLDAITQAAGRCNRNGRANLGNVCLFLPAEEAYPDGAYRQAADVTGILLKKSPSKSLDIHSPDTFENYYQNLYDLVRPENRNEELLKSIKLQDFTKVATLYRVIPDVTINVLVPYDITLFRALEEEVFQTGLTRRWMAKARPYTIGLFRPKANDPVWACLNPVSKNKPGHNSNDDWFVYSNVEHYSRETGLLPQQSMDCLIA